MVIWKFSASLASTLVLTPRSLKMSQMMSEGRKPMMPPRWANDAHCLSSASMRGAAGCGAGCAGSVMVVVPFSEERSLREQTLTLVPAARPVQRLADDVRGNIGSHE